MRGNQENEMFNFFKHPLVQAMLATAVAIGTINMALKMLAASPI